jgi:hypothetical protein
VIDVDERGGLRHVRVCRDARCCRDVFEPPVGLLPEEPIASGAKDEDHGGRRCRSRQPQRRSKRQSPLE